ncbi:hypothetical protein [Streptomyces sp. NPDC088350]|uniref:hypothetical protein n=1 Tax=Streptomyces sp. NPDC088350 TaxID=3365854 RepID=UPI00381DBBEB
MNQQVHVRSDQSQLFRDAMASFPSGVTVVTTTDDTGRWCWCWSASTKVLNATPRS